MDNLIAARSQMAMSLALLAAACKTQDPSSECHFLCKGLRSSPKQLFWESTSYD
jgi:hypothetical protein